MEANVWLLALCLEVFKNWEVPVITLLSKKLFLSTTKLYYKRITRKQLYKKLVYCCHLLFSALSFPLLFQWGMENKFEKKRS